MGTRGTSLEASVDVEYTDDPDVVLTEDERERLCDYWNCREHKYGEEQCPIKRTEKKVLERAKEILDS